MILISKITGKGDGIAATGTSASVKVGLDLTGFIIWVVVIAIYFFAAKKIWGKTVGGLIVDTIAGKKK